MCNKKLYIWDWTLSQQIMWHTVKLKIILNEWVVIKVIYLNKTVTDIISDTIKVQAYVWKENFETKWPTIRLMIPPLSRYLRWKQAWRCLQITRRLDFSVNEQISYFKIQCPKQSWKLKIFINSYWSTIRNNLLYKKECYLCRKGIVKLTKCPPILHTPPSINGVVSTQTREWES